MEKVNVPQWLTWAREIQALAQTGHHYAKDDFQRQRYTRLTEIAAEMVAAQTSMELSDILVVYEAPVGYATPRVDVRGAVFKDGKLLLVRERADGGWTLPGGWADVGEIPSQAAEREVFEEAGYQVRACKVIGVYDANRSGTLELFHAYKIVFLCNLLGGDAKDSNETSEVAFFAEQEIPSTLSGERTHARHIRDAFAAWENSELPTVFD